MGLGAATQYTQIQALKAGMGGLAGSPAVPSSWTAHISMTPPNDDGSNITEFSGDTYAPAAVPGWSAASTSIGGGSDPADYNGVIQPSGTIHFPTPTAEWWPNLTDIWPYLTDPGGNVLWYWHALCNVVSPAHPLSITPGLSVTTAPYPALACQLSSWMGVGEGVAHGTPGFPNLWLQTILKVLFGQATFSLSSLSVGIVTATGGGAFGAGEPTGDPNYARLPIGSISGPTITGDGRATCTNGGAYTWTVTAGHSGSWGGPFQSVFVSDSSGTEWFSFFPVSSAGAADGETVTVPAGSLKWQVH